MHKLTRIAAASAAVCMLTPMASLAQSTKLEALQAQYNYLTALCMRLKYDACSAASEVAGETTAERRRTIPGYRSPLDQAVENHRLDEMNRGIAAQNGVYNDVYRREVYRGR